jgi:hypothetical protein
MPRITITVEATAGSHIGHATAPGHSIFARSHHADGWPIGWGHITDTSNENYALSALTLMTEPALPGELHAWPIGLIQLGNQHHCGGRLIVTCVEEAPPFLDLIDLDDPTGWHADVDDWLDALRRLRPHTPRHARAHGGRGEAEALIASAQQAYQRLSTTAPPSLPLNAQGPR